MAQDVSSKMAEEPCLLNQDGYLNADTDVKEIVYHPTLNVILICTSSGVVRVLDVNTGVILHSSNLSAVNQNEVTCRYIPCRDRILICDGQALGVRSDYNGVLLLDSVLQKAVVDRNDEVLVELPLSDAVLLKQSFNLIGIKGYEKVTNELNEQIIEGQKSERKGIKAQKWHTVCLKVPIGELRTAAQLTVTHMIGKNLHIPELAVASAVQERMSELLGETANPSNRRAMASESKRKETFSQWPHMDYKWALPEQMAQAGFYHQPNASGDDRAMCFTCTVCLVCWEKTDEPWSEHERHSQDCPFIIGEYTQNVPMSVTYGSNPAVDATYRGLNVKLIGNSAVPHLIPTSNSDGLVSIFDIGGKITWTHSFFVSPYDSYVLDKVTQELNNSTVNYDNGSANIYPTEKSITALSIVDQKPNNNNNSNSKSSSSSKESSKTVRPTLICGLTIRVNAPEPPHYSTMTIESFSEEYRSVALVDENMEVCTQQSCLFLVVYDFLHTQSGGEVESLDSKLNFTFFPAKKKLQTLHEKPTTTTTTTAAATTTTTTTASVINGLENVDELNFSSNYLMKHVQTIYKTLIPGEADELYFSPPPLPSTTTPTTNPVVSIPDTASSVKWYKPRTSSTSSETDSSQNGGSGAYVLNQDLMFNSGTTPIEKSITDHINDLKSKKPTKKLDCSKAVQCVVLPSQFKNRSDLTVSDIVMTQDGRHVVVALRSSRTDDLYGGAFVLYSLDFTGPMVKLNPTPVVVRELFNFENPRQIVPMRDIDKPQPNNCNTSNSSDRFNQMSDAEGTLIVVCEDGAVRLVNAANLKTSCYAKIEGEKFVSAAYCNSLERLCASTEKGSLHFFVLNENDDESLEEHDDTDETATLFEPSTTTICPDTLDAGTAAEATLRYFHDPHSVIDLADLKRLHILTQFEPFKSPYCSVVSSCWTEIQQAQRQRRHPQSLRIDDEAFAKTWRLQTDLTTWDEHVFEIALPYPLMLGHVDVQFTLQSSTVTPNVEVTLLKQNVNGVGHKKEMNFSVDEPVTIDMLQWADNPVVSQEYLKSYDADILAGPVNVASCLDLTERGGKVTLTSPKLFKSRNRTFLVHLRVVCTKEEQNNRNNAEHVTKTAETFMDKLSFTSKKADFYVGCDCIHELSITVHTTKDGVVDSSTESLTPFDRHHRCFMLESNVFLQSLIRTTIDADARYGTRSFALDILNWIASIRLTRNRSFNGQAPPQQLEFLKVIERFLVDLLNATLLNGERTIAHRCAQLITACVSGARNIGETEATAFEQALMNVMLSLLDRLSSIKSAGGLQWLFNLILLVARSDDSDRVSDACKNLLVKVSDELIKKLNPYHLLLRSRYGLYGTPIEPELFDVEHPPYPKGSSMSITYANVVAGDSPNLSSNFYSNYSFYKEIVNPKEVLSTSKGKMKCRNASPAKHLRGLIETEPLNFVCVAASDGTKLDKAEDGNSVLSNIIVNNLPVGTNFPDADGTTGIVSNLNTNKKAEMQQFWDHFVDIVKEVKQSKNGAAQTISEKFANHLKFPPNFPIKGAIYFDSPETTPPIYFSDVPNVGKIEKKTDVTPAKNLWQSEDMFTQEMLPSSTWQHLFLGSPQQVIVVERMNSGARRFVTLDFGRPVLLTDVMMPACNDLVSISIDVWLKSEELDPIRIAVSSDIGTRNLVLNDLLPPPICRYVKITVVGRFGMSATRSRIPIGFFYGHSILIEDELPLESGNFVKLCSYSELETHFLNLSKLFEDISCRYSISCSKLKEALDGFIVADVKNASHLLNYMNIMKDKNLCTSAEHNKIFQAYKEAVTYQRQLNIVRRIMNRMEGNVRTVETSKGLSSVCTDKLKAIAEGLLEVLLSLDCSEPIDRNICEKLFEGLCVSQTPRLQFLAATYLKNTTYKTDYWGNFLADTLSEMFASSYVHTFPQDRVFILLAYLSKRTTTLRSCVLDAALRVTHKCLTALNDDRKSLLAMVVDLPLLSWLLMYLSLQLDFNKKCPKSITRWDWVFGEMAGKATVENSKNRMQKKTMKKQMDPASKIKIHSMAKDLVPSTISVLKNGTDVFIKMLNTVSMYQSKTQNSLNAIKKSLDNCASANASETNSSEKGSPKRAPLFIDHHHCRVVARDLVKLLLSMDHSSSADMLLLSFKVISRLACIAKIPLGGLMTQDHLLKLIDFCLSSNIPWAPHALACLLEDILDLWPPEQQQSYIEMETESVPSTSWESSSEHKNHIKIIYDHIVEAPIQPAKVNNANTKTNQLPSVYESDSSEIDEFIEVVLGKERQGQSKKTSSRSSVSTSNCLNSNTIDSRLDFGVGTDTEIALRSLLTRNNHTLMQNITATVYRSDSDEADEGSTPWTELSTEAVESATTVASIDNRKILKDCFEKLFQSLDRRLPEGIEHVIQLWLTLNCATNDDRFDSSTVPTIPLSAEAVASLIRVLAYTPGLSLVTWCVSLQTLTLACNTDFSSSASVGLAANIVEHPDFVQFLFRLLSGSGVIYSDKGVFQAGPSLCRAVKDLLIRLQIRCDVVTPSSKMGAMFKTLMLKLLYQLIQPSGPVASKHGPLDAQCKVVQLMLYMDFGNADLGIAMSILECTGSLVHLHLTNADRVRCNYSGDTGSPSFIHLYSTVLGTDFVKQDRLVSSEILIIALLKLLGKLVKTPLPNESGEDVSEAMDTEPLIMSQTDESKAEQIQQDAITSPVPCLADLALKHHSSVILLCSTLASCKTSSLCMLAWISQKNTLVCNFTEPSTLADGVFYVLMSLAKSTSRKDLIMQPLLMFLSHTPQLSEPLLWFILQVLDTEVMIRNFFDAGGLSILGTNFVMNSNTPHTISKTGTISTVMQYFHKTNKSVECNITTVCSPKKTSAADEQSTGGRMSLVNFAPCSSIRCNSTTAQPADVLIQSGTTTHRRARTPQWSYHFYPEEIYTELVLTLPTAVLLKQVHLQPHSVALSTCPSAIALEISANGPSRLVPLCPPMATSGMSYIQMELPTPEVVNCVLIRLYKPRTANNISLSLIKLLGFSAFSGKSSSLVFEDERQSKHSLGWIRLLNHCFAVVEDRALVKDMVASCAQVPDLLTTACGMLLVPSHVQPDYLPCLEKVIAELSLHNLDCSMITMRVLLENKCSSIDMLNATETLWQDRLLVNNSGYQSACELLYQICEHQDVQTPYRVSILLDWLRNVIDTALNTGTIRGCNPAYISCIASILWYANANSAGINYDLKSMITVELFEGFFKLKKLCRHNANLKYTVDAMLCSICYVRPEFYPNMLRNMSLPVNLCDDSKQSIVDGEYGSSGTDAFSHRDLSADELETIAMVSRSPTSIRQLLESGLPKMLNATILDFCQTSNNVTDDDVDMVVAARKLEKITAVLKFFTDVAEESSMRDWLGSTEGSSFWLYLLQWLCKKTSTRKYNLESEVHVRLEENCIKFLAKCCLCHRQNQDRLARVLCDVISLQTNGITGFMRRLVLQLLLEHEKIPVNIVADETLFKSVRSSQSLLPTHPAFKQTYKRTMLHLSMNTSLWEILEEHVFFNPHKIGGSDSIDKDAGVAKKLQLSDLRKDLIKGLFATEDSDLSVAAGVLAKDKRAKDNKNMMFKSSMPVKKKRYGIDESAGDIDWMGNRSIVCENYSDRSLPLSLTLGQLLMLIESKNRDSDWPCIHLTISHNKGAENKQQPESAENEGTSQESLTKQQCYSSALHVFSAMGGLALLAQHLPAVYPETLRQTNGTATEKMSMDQSESEWVKLEDYDDIYEDETVGSNPSPRPTNLVANVPLHSLTAFGLFLRLPGYAEILLKDMKEALCLLRLVLGVTDDGEDGDIFQSSVAGSLPTLPFEVLRKLYDSTGLNTDDGRLLRRISINSGVIHLLLACLGIFTHLAPNNEKDGNEKEGVAKEENNQLYWAKGTGYGTGSTQQSWNVEQALLKQRSEEEHVTILLRVLASYINPNGEATDELASDVLPSPFHDLLLNSCLLPALSSYLRNDSVLDMARHIPLYKAALQLLRAIAVSSQLVDLLLPQKMRNDQPSITSLLRNMKGCVDTYTSKLKLNTKTNTTKSKSKVTDQLTEELDQGEGLATLMPDIRDSANLVSKVTSHLIDSDQEGDSETLMDRTFVSIEERYLSVMKKLQFGSYEMITELPGGGIKFVISHHFESNAKMTNEQSHPARVKRIAQETVTLSSSLPLSYSSSVFVRYDNSRLDVMKVLITGPADTPYANGCFELDVFFPQDYPLLPMMINLETTGHHSVRFNPNLYNDGKVCLSVLNTWHGRPEEKWNVQTSSFLQVLVSIQSLILVPEPYFNEPGYERSRGTPAGNQSSREYNATVCQATARWAMLEQILNPCPCFKDIILTHFYLKRFEIMEQLDKWLADLENDITEKKVSRTSKRASSYSIEQFKKVSQQLKDQLMKIKPPDFLEEDEEEEENAVTPTNSGSLESQETVQVEQSELDNDVEMEKMVNEMCE